MSQNDALHERITRLFAQHLNVEIASSETDLFDTGVLDSLGFVELLVALEREFGLAAAVDDLEVCNFKSIARIAEFVTARATDGRSASEVTMKPVV